MSSFQTEIRRRVADSRRQLAEAETIGDHYLMDVLAGELESLSRLAADHHVSLDLGEADCPA